MRKKIHPKIYNGATGEPFRTEKYQDATIEFYYYDDNALANKFLGNSRFYVWTCNGLDYRLFVERGYYEAVGKDLFSNALNEIQLDFSTLVYNEQARTQKRYLFTSLAIMIPGLALAFGLSMIEQLGQWGFLIPLGIVLIGMYVISGRSNKRLRLLVGEENAKASERIKGVLGEQRFEDLLSAQAQYAKDFFGANDDVVADNIDEELADIEPLGDNPYIDNQTEIKEEITNDEVLEQEETTKEE